MSSNVVILGKAGTNETYIPFSLNDGGVLYTDQAPNSNAGIIQGRDLNLGGVDFGVVLDGMGTNLNALPTVSRMYATNPDTGAIQPVGINTAGELITTGTGGGGGGGVVEGIDTTSGLATNISATNTGLNVNILGVDTIGAGTLVGLATTLINETINTNMYAYDTTLASGVALTAEVNALTNVNRLYTHSNLFVNTEGTVIEAPLNCDADGYLNVHIQAGGGGGGGIVQGKVIATGLGADITAEVNALSGINALYTHSSIYGKDPITEQDKQVEVNTEGQISVLVKNASLPVNVSDGAGLPLSSTVQTVGTTPTNFLNTYSRMVGSSNGTDFKTALMDTGGRLQVNARISDTAGGGLASSSVGGIKALNVVDLNQTYSAGNLNVNVANTATTNSNTRDGAGTLITSTLVGVKQGLDVNIIAGGGGGGGGGVVQLQAYSSIDGTTPVNVEATANRLLVDSNIVDADNPLRKLVVNEDGSINVAGSSSVVQGIDTTSGLGVNIGATDTRLLTNSLLVSSTNIPMTTTSVAGGKEGLDVAVISNSSIIQGFDTGTLTNVNINATDNRLLTNSLLIGQTAGATPTQHAVITTAGGNLIVEAKAHDGTNNPIDSTVVGTDRGLDVYVLGNNSVLKGSYNNIANNISLTAGANSTALNINNEYGNESVISYEDSSFSITSFISIYGSFDNTTFFYIGVLQPALIRSTLRQASTVLKLKGIKWIRIVNEHNNTVSNVKSTLFSGE